MISSGGKRPHPEEPEAKKPKLESLVKKMKEESDRGSRKTVQRLTRKVGAAGDKSIFSRLDPRSRILTAGKIVKMGFLGPYRQEVAVENDPFPKRIMVRPLGP